MESRITNRAIITIRLISHLAIIVTMGMILTVIGASIYGMIGATH
jgi:hypothetical protein